MTYAKIFAMSNNHPLQVYTDHSPLTWIKHTSGKGPVSQFIIDSLSELDYTISYIRGPDNIYADALSRFPCLGPEKLQDKGIKHAIIELLTTISNSDVNTTKIWLDCKKDTKHILPTLTEWIAQMHTTTKPMSIKTLTDNTTLAKIAKSNYTFAILAPHADICTQLVRALLAKKLPFAFLMPTDLIHHTAKTNDGYNSHIR